MAGEVVYDAIVIGAGMAGLRTASLLKEKGHTVLILEAQDRVGGRTKGELTRDGTQFDVGGQWVGPTQDRLYKLINKYNLELVPQPTKGIAIWDRAGNVTRTFEPSIPGFGIASLICLQLMLWRLDELAEYVPLEDPWKAPKAKEWDDLSLEGWLSKSYLGAFGGKQLFYALDIISWSLVCTEPSRVSFLWFLWFIKCSGGTRALIDTEGGAQQDKVKGGIVQVAQKLFEEIGEETVEFEAFVKTISQTPEGVTVTYTANDKEEKIVKSKKIIVAIPPQNSAAIKYEPALPLARTLVENTWKMGNVIKTVAFYQTPFWTDNGHSGLIVSDSDIIRLAFDGSLHFPDRDLYCLVGFIPGNAALYWSQKTKEERKAAVEVFYNRTFGVSFEIVDFLEHDWVNDISRGGYMALPGPGSDFARIAHAVREPFGHIHFAGTETALHWSGYIEGALESAERVSKEIDLALTQSVPLLRSYEPFTILSSSSSSSSSSSALSQVAFKVNYPPLRLADPRTSRNRTIWSLIERLSVVDLVFRGMVWVSQKRRVRAIKAAAKAKAKAEEEAQAQAKAEEEAQAQAPGLPLQ